ncbi:MAG: nucleotidyltransferase family protein [Prevotella sp.]|nr:nucleotidyltransferase family protein [Prevotella sp.]
MVEEYLEFLRFCIDEERPVPDCVNRICWHNLLEFAQKQAVVGVFFHGMKRITNGENKPTDDDVLEWMAETSMLVKRNEELFNRSAFAVEAFRKEGFRSCILKGQGNALMYPDPFMRTPGDIDIWVEGERSKIYNYVKGFFPDTHDQYHEIHFPILKGIVMEVHYVPCFFNNLYINKRLQEYFKNHSDEQYRHREQMPTGELLCMPTNDFNRVFQMTHIMKHFFSGGIGYRHFVDYYYLLKRGFTEEECKKDLEIFSRLKMVKFVRGAMWILKNNLGLDKQYLLVEPDEKIGRMIESEMVIGGDFGKYDQRYRLPIKGKVISFVREIYRDLHFVKEFPSESLSRPVFLVWHQLRDIKKLFGGRSKKKSKS